MYCILCPHIALYCPCYTCIRAGLQPLQHNPYTEPLWKAAVAQYDRGMAPAELRIASKLRTKFHELEAQPHQLLREFQRYKELVRRPAVSKELIPERYMYTCVCFTLSPATQISSTYESMHEKQGYVHLQK